MAEPSPEPVRHDPWPKRPSSRTFPSHPPPGSCWLALLPIPAGNIDQNQAYIHLMAMRADLQYAAQRSQNLEEFKEMIRDMRLRKEREREFEQNQRTAPPPAEPATP